MIATEADIPLIVELGREAHAATVWGEMAEFCPASFEASCRLLMERDDAAVFVCDRGSLWLAKCPLFFNHGETICHEAFYFATHNGDALRREALRWAGAGLVTFSRNHATDERLERIYERAGFRPIEHSFIARRA